jgi:hypothetical protein
VLGGFIPVIAVSTRCLPVGGLKTVVRRAEIVLLPGPNRLYIEAGSNLEQEYFYIGLNFVKTLKIPNCMHARLI